MLSLSRPAIAAAGLGGALWTVKALVITANDGSFSPLEDAVFLGGLAALTTAAVLVAWSLTRRLRPPARVAATIAGTIALVAATIAIETLGKALVGGLATGDNLGLEEEGGILLAGVVWTTLAIVAARAGERRSGARAVTA